MIERAWPTRGPAWLPDAALAFAVAVLELANLVLRGTAPHGWALDAVLLVASAVPLVARRRFPVAVGLVVAADVIVLAALGIAHLGLSVLVVVYGVAAYRARGRLAFAALAVAATVLVPLLTPDDVADIPRNLALYAAAWAIGTLHRQRARSARELERRADELLEQREYNARLAADAERGRIARDLHDVVAHSLSVMVVQTGAARAIAGSHPERVDGILARVEAVGRESLAEVRRVLGAVRAAREDVPLGPQPGLADLDALVGRFRDAGLPVALTVQGPARPVAATVDAAGYRVVQEALTNVLKHAQGAGHVSVAVAFGASGLELEVVDDAPPGDGANDGGYGLVGIRERAALVGGAVSIGPRPSGGFRVAAVFPDTEPR